MGFFRLYSRLGLLAAVAVLVALCASCSNDSTSFIFFTDTHFPDSEPEQAALLEPICRTEGVTRVIWGGDAISRYADPDSAWAIQLDVEKQISRFAAVYNVRGNHDFSRRVRPGEEGTGSTLSQEETARRLSAVRGQDAVPNEADPGACYYYFDDVKAQVRFLVLDTHDEVPDQNVAMGTRYGIGQMQLQWVCTQAIGTVPPDWSLLVFSHAPVWWPGMTEKYEGAFAQILAAARDRGVSILAWMSGHIHRDTQLAQEGLWEITTYCYTPTAPRVLMFDTEKTMRDGADRPCFEVATLEKGHKILRLRRVGAGHSRTFHLESIVLKEGSSVKIHPRMNAVSRWECLDAYGNYLHHEKWTYECRSVTLDPATGTVTAMQEGEAMVVAFAPDGERESFLIQVKP